MHRERKVPNTATAARCARLITFGYLISLVSAPLHFISGFVRLFVQPFPVVRHR
jgi:hypothetical protein